MSVVVTIAVAFVGYAHLAGMLSEPLDMWRDGALIELGVRRAARFEQMLGAYSRFGWHHPGPAYFYALAPFEAVLGPRGMQFGTWTLNMAAYVASVAVIRRCVSEVAARAAATVLLGVLLCIPLSFGWSVWNPMVLILPLILLSVLVATAWRPSLPGLLSAMLVGSFLVQAHISVAAPVLALTAYGVVGFWVGNRRLALETRRRDSTEGRRSKRALAGLLTVTIVLIWIPPTIQQMIGGYGEGNFAKIARSLSDGDGRSVGPGHGTEVDATAGPGPISIVRTLTTQASAVPVGYDPARTAVTDALPVSTGRAVALLLIVAAACAVIVLVRQAVVKALAGCTLLAVAVAPVVLAVSSGPQYWFLSIWMVAVPVPTVLALAIWFAGISHDIGGARDRRSTMLGILLSGVAVLVSLELLRTPVDVVSASLEGNVPDGRLVAEFVVDRYGVGPGDAVLLVPTDDLFGWGDATAMAAALDRSGVSTTVPDEWLFKFGSSARSDGSEDVVVSIVRDGAMVPEELGVASEPVARFGGGDVWILDRSRAAAN